MVLLSFKMYRHVWKNMENAGEGGVSGWVTFKAKQANWEKKKEKKKICVLTQCPNS